MADKQEILKNNLDYTFFSWSKQAGLNPIPVKTAKGVYFYDYDGKKYIDFSSQLMNANVGHGHPKVIEAIKNQAGELPFITCSMATNVRGELGKKLAQRILDELTTGVVLPHDSSTCQLLAYFQQHAVAPPGDMHSLPT